MIAIRDLHKSLGGQEILRGVDLDVTTGETCVVLGRSGGGKSVLLKHIVGLLKPDSGEVRVEGENIATIPERQLVDLRKRVGVLFQSGALFDSMSVEENIAFPLREAGVKKPEELRARVAEALEMVDLAGEQKKMPSSLSGGMRKRVGLARTIVGRPRCILYDEPTTGLDPIATDSINHLIRRLQKRLSVTSVVVTHDMKTAFHTANRIAFLHEGRIYFNGTADELRHTSDPVLQDFIEGRSGEQPGDRMSTERKGAAVYVGLFLLLGFGAIAYMVILFGKTGEKTAASYPLVVEFPNASGLAKGATVLLAGANIGRVYSGPNLEAGTYRITATLYIRADVKLPRTTRFVIASSGLLGDRFVDVQIPEGFKLDDPLQPGEAIAASKSGGGGLSELTDKGSIVMDRLVVELEHIEALTLRLNEGILHDRNLKNIEQTFDNLKVTTDRFRTTSEGLDGVVKKAGGLLDTTSETIKTADSAAADLKVAIADLRKMIVSATKAVDTTASLMRKAQDGEGTLGTLIQDKKMAEDLKALAANLRRSGVLFYKDRPLPEAAAPVAPAPRRR